MAYDIKLADKVRKYLVDLQNFNIEEKKMFGGLAFVVNDKMCINISGNRLMCRFDPKMEEEISNKIGYRKMIMKGREYKGYCYVEPEGFQTDKDFDYWVNVCLKFNEKARSSKKSKKKK